MTAYVIANIRIINPVLFEPYKALSTIAVKSYGGHFLVRGGRTESAEGTWDPDRLTVIEFPSWERASAYVHSEEYGKAREARRAAAFFDMIIVEGIQG